MKLSNSINTVKLMSMATLVLMVSACSDQSTSQEQGHQMPPSPVSITEIQGREAAHTIRVPARVHGSLEVEVRAQVGGILLERRFTEGEFVEKGQPLFLIDPELYQAAANNAQAELENAQVNHAQALRDWQRIENLFANDTVSEREYEQTRTALESAEARLVQAEVGLTNAERDLRYTEVQAPISGYTSFEQVSVGNLVSQGAPLTQMVQSNPVYVQFSLSEKDLATYRRSLSTDEQMRDVTIFSADNVAHAHPGKIQFIDNRINPASSQVVVRANVPNPDQQLVSGEYVRVAITLRKFSDAILIDPKAVSQGRDGAQVYVVNDESQAIARTVELGPMIGSQQLVVEGLVPGERLITNGHVAVGNGAPVTITNE